jgi:hypothetical protein
MRGELKLRRCSQSASGSRRAGTVPVSAPGCNSLLVVLEAMLEEVEDAEFLSCHNIRGRLCLYLRPDSGELVVKNLSDGRVLLAIRRLSCDLQSLGHSSETHGSHSCLAHVFGWRRATTTFARFHTADEGA